MRLIGGDPFLDEFHMLVEQARADQVAHAERVRAAALAREARARELLEHVVRRFTALAATHGGADRAVEYEHLGIVDEGDLPATHVLHWRVTRPLRKLEAMVSLRTGRYWLRLLQDDGEPGRTLHDDQGDDVMNVSVDEVDRLIRRLADQQAWQGAEPAAPGAVERTHA